MCALVTIYISHKLTFMLKYEISINDNCDGIGESIYTIGNGVVCIHKCYGMMRVM